MLSVWFVEREDGSMAGLLVGMLAAWVLAYGRLAF